MTTSYQKAPTNNLPLPVPSLERKSKRAWIGGLLLAGILFVYTGFNSPGDDTTFFSISSSSSSPSNSFSLLGRGRGGHSHGPPKKRSRGGSGEKEFYPLQLAGYPDLATQKQFLKDLELIDWKEVKKDIVDVMTHSEHWWPADYGTYGGLFVRLSWHACGSYRTSDGRGGCDGGGQRFDPERSWPDNTNLDKARRLLEPVKHKHGNGLSWGDLFALVGTAAIEHMGAPVLGFCAGRIDMVDNTQTRLLGPTPEQEKWAHCEVQGDCKSPLGQNTLGLIYVNPEGPMGEPNPQGAADTIRDVFGRMDWKGKELVALIGGGHAFGKAHGATTHSPGDPPDMCPYAPWAGATGVKAVTSGFEGAWTEHPTKWDNDYFKYLDKFVFEPIVGPGGHHQWRVKGGGGPQAPSADPTSHKKHDIMMLTTDVSLATDEEYKQYVHEFATNISALEGQFAYAWYKLVTRDVGPVSRCLGPNVPEPQQWQHPLPDPLPSQFKTNYGEVAKEIVALLHTNHSVRRLKHHEEDHKGHNEKHDEKHHHHDRFVELAWQCASTYRATDHQGGCNGARIRFPPGNMWPINKGLDESLDELAVVKIKFGDGLSWADLIVLAGNVALHLQGADTMEFCPGRTDAEDGSGWDLLSYGIDTEPTTVDQMMDVYERRGQTAKEFVALTWRFYKTTKQLGHVILDTSDSSEHNVLEQGLKFYPELRVWAEYYVSMGDKVYKADFAEAWTKVMNADRFDGPIGNVCY